MNFMPTLFGFMITISTLVAFGQSAQDSALASPEEQRNSGVVNYSEAYIKSLITQIGGFHHVSTSIGSALRGSIYKDDSAEVRSQVRKTIKILNMKCVGLNLGPETYATRGRPAFSCLVVVSVIVNGSNRQHIANVVGDRDMARHELNPIALLYDGATTILR